MSGSFSRIFLSSLLSLVLVACGGGGGGGNKPTPPADTDGDGYADTRDAFPNDPKEWLDTDKDGVGDNGDAFPSDATETKDTDKDGVGDNKDLFPSDASETLDTDKDGVGDNGDTDPMGQPIPAWTTYQGNSKHTGHVDITLTSANFKARWNKSVELTTLNQGAAGDGTIFFNNAGLLYALDARTGATQWTQSVNSGQFNFNAYNPPAYADGVVYVQTGGHNNAFLWAFNGTDGRLLFKSPLEDQSSNHYAPTIMDGTVYIGGGYFGGMYAIDAKTGMHKWWQTLNQSDQFTPAISGDYVIAYTKGYTSKLTLANKTTGNLYLEIDDPDSQGSSSMNLAPVVAGEYVLVNHYGRLVAFNLTSKQLAWQVDANFTGEPVIKGERFYIINNGVIEARALSDGALESSITGAAAFTSNLLLTNNLLFVSDDSNTHAYYLDTGAIAWTLADKHGKLLMAEGALVIFGSSGITTQDLEGDIDSDGLPDWWEKRLKKNVNATADSDNDGLTGLQEFEQKTNPAVADTDGDGLLDGEEVTGAQSSPLIADTDGDGLLDGAEVKTHLSNPTKADSDDDGLSDKEEVAAGMNPNSSADALQDTDGDGYSNLHEVRANTSISDANKYPAIADWSMVGGNSMGNNYVPLLLNDSQFSQRWSKTSNAQLATGPVTAGHYLVERINDQLQVWDSGTGQEAWRTAITANSFSAPATSGDKLVVLSSEATSTTHLNVWNISSGANLVDKELASSGYRSTNNALTKGDKLYLTNSSRSFQTYSLSSGNLLWNSGLHSDYFSGNSRHLASDEHLVGITSSKLVVYSAQDGSLLNTLSLPSNNNTQTAILGGRNNVIVQLGAGQFSSINLSDGSTEWSRSDCNQARIAVGNGKVYALTEQKLCVYDEQTGASLWELPLTNNWQMSNPVLTASHLFYSDGTSTYAVDLQQKQVTWSINQGANQLFISADGTLYIQNTFTVTAIDTAGDTDGDGMLQWWERRYGGDLLANGDEDADGLANLEEFTAKSNPLMADTDGDGLNDELEVDTYQTSPINTDTDNDGLTDGAEVNTHATNPTLIDSDSDGIDDSRELAFGLNANVDDASADADSDGFSNRDEIYAGTQPNNAASKPALGDWVPSQGNAAHNAFQPYRVDTANFGLRWSKNLSRYLKPVTTGNQQLFLVDGYDGDTLTALNAVDGTSQWQKYLGPNNRVTSVAYMNAKVLVNTTNPIALQGFNASNGASLFNNNYTSYNYSEYTPSLFDDVAYNNLGYSGGIVAKDLLTGATLWSNSQRNSYKDIAVNNQYVFSVADSRIHALERATGSDAFAIDIEGSNPGDPVLGTRNNLLLAQNVSSSFLLASYDLTGRKLNWQVPSQNIEGKPVAGNGRVYYLSGGQLRSISETNGELFWEWRPDDQYLSGNILVTYSHVFVSSGSKTYALAANTGALLWTYNAGGQLALGADGALYIQNETQLIAINLEGDSDGDTLPDWWERHYGLNPANSSDASQDKDGDGLTNLQEFSLKTYADDADSDDDQLSDLTETSTHNTDPLQSDSDNDGMPDGWEISNSFNPLSAIDRDADTDGDSVPNYFEYQQATDPNNALSLPAFFNPGQFSFEDSQLPAGWSISNDTTDLSISLGVASHGSKALQARNIAKIEFSGFFAASDLSLDMKYGCAGSTELEIYIDDQLQTRVQAGSEWSSLKTLIPLGQHSVSIRSNSYNCSLYLDNVVIAAAKTNTELAVQFASLRDNNLQFHDINGIRLRQLAARLPVANSSVRGFTAIGNDQLAVVFGSKPVQVGLLNLATFNWRYFDGLEALDSNYSYGNIAIATTDTRAYLVNRESFGSSNSIVRLDLLSGAVAEFGSHAYDSLAVDSAGFIYAHSYGVVYKYDPASLTLVSQVNTVNAKEILIDHLDRLIVLTTGSEVIRYNAQRLVEARLQLSSITSMAMNGRGDLFLSKQQDGTVLHYSPNWQRVKTLSVSATQLTGFPQADSDGDQLPDWWELAYGLAANNASDASSDTDGDGLTALQEFNADTDPTKADSDDDLLSDGDEINDFGTDPNKKDSDSDGLTDAEELLDHQSNPLKVDSDGDLVSDYLEVIQYQTDPSDANSKPAALSNYLESFEAGNGGWIRPSGDADAGWSVVSDTASQGTKSLRAGTIGNNQTAEVDWTAVYNTSTLSFDARVSSESCCDRLLVYLDDENLLNLHTDNQWQTYYLTIPAGVHTLRFVYQKDGSSSSGEDTAWIDNIRVQ